MKEKKVLVRRMLKCRDEVSIVEEYDKEDDMTLYEVYINGNKQRRLAIIDKSSLTILSKLFAVARERA